MSPQYLCQNDNRHQLVEVSKAQGSQHALNGIDYVEVASEDQKTLELHFLRPLPGENNGVPTAPLLTQENIVITGGIRVRNIRVEKVIADKEVLTILVSDRGDFSFYTLKLVKSSFDLSPPEDFDPQLSEIEFSFKAGCPSDFDCRRVRECPPEKRT